MTATRSPLVSIVMPAYNAEFFIAESISAILDQEFTDFEFIIVDDGSTDKTREKILSFEDSRIRLLRNDINSGIVITLNLGLSVAQGKYIVRTDADDIALPHMVGHLTAFMESNPDHIVCGGNMQLIGGSRLFTYPTHNDDLKVSALNACPFSHSTVIIRTSILRSLNVTYDSYFQDAEDFGMWSTLLPYGKFHNLDEVTLYYRQSQSQITARPEYTRRRAESLKKIFQFHAQHYFDLQPEQIVSYISLMEGNPPHSYAALEEFGKLLVLMGERNKEKRIFSQPKLDQVIFIKWYAVCEKCQGSPLLPVLIFIRYIFMMRNFVKLIYAAKLFINRMGSN